MKAKVKAKRPRVDPRIGWQMQCKHENMWRGWRNLTSYYGIGRKEAEARAEVDHKSYLGATEWRVVAHNARTAAAAEQRERRARQMEMEEAKPWSYSFYRATLRLNGKAFAICSPDGNHALTLEDAEKLLKELNHK